MGQNPLVAQRQLQLALAYLASDTVTPRLLVVTRERVNYFAPTWPEAGLAAIGRPRLLYDEASAHPDASMVNLATVDFNRYDVVLVASDDRGPLSQSEVDGLSARKEDLRRFVNAGGSVIAMAESGLGPDVVNPVRTNLFGFLSLPVTAAAMQGSGIGNTVAAAGARLGLTDADVNGDPTWEVFTSSGNMEVIDRDSAGRILTLAVRDHSLATGSAITNEAPTVSVPAAGFVHLNQVAQLAGTVTDDGVPAGVALTVSWTQVSGPGTTTFANAASASTTATFSQVGRYILRLSASDSLLSSSADVLIDVLDANEAPIVSAGPDQDIASSSTRLEGSVSDDGHPVGAALTWGWQEESGPGNVKFADPSLLTTVATLAAPGTYTLRLSATDTALTAPATVTVVVLRDKNQPPIVVAGSYALLAYTQRDLYLAGTAVDDGNPAPAHLVATWSLRAGAGTARFDDVHDLNTVVHFSWPGQYVLHLHVTDGELSSFDEVVVTVGAAAGSAPAVALTSPDEGQPVTSAVDVVGSVSGGEWQLELALGADDTLPQTYRRIAGGTGAISGVLATLDPTQLLNGTYSLRLRAFAEGGEAEDQRSVFVDKNLKIGTFAFSLTDLSVPVPGLPVQVIRSYDSRDSRDGDFGHGWSLSLSDVRLEKSAVLGKFWAERIQGSYAFPSYCLETTRPEVVTVTFPTGKVYRFDATLSITCQPLAPIDTAELQFTPQKGTVGSLRVLDRLPVVAVSRPYGLGASVQLLDSDGSVYNPRDFVLTTEDGTQYAIHQGRGLTWVQDRNGNRLTFSPAGIASSAGKSVTFLRDAAGHITEITDPNGNSLLYGYDERGDMVSFTDRAGNTTKFAYSPAHQLLTITDPRGKQVLGNHYDDSGRLASTDDAAGKSIVFGHDLEHHRETVTDRSGKTTTYEYDRDGNVVHVVDALGHETFSTYDENDNKLSETDALGHTTRWTYDAHNNKTSEKTTLTYITKWRYD